MNNLKTSNFDGFGKKASSIELCAIVNEKNIYQTGRVTPDRHVLFVGIGILTDYMDIFPIHPSLAFDKIKKFSVLKFIFRLFGVIHFSHEELNYKFFMRNFG